MPPALSDYDEESDFGFDTFPSQSSPGPTVGKAVDDIVKKSSSPKLSAPDSPVVESPVQEQVPPQHVKRHSEKGRPERDIEHTTSKKRKRKNILAGLELENILSVAQQESREKTVTADQSPTSSAPTSCYRTRASISTCPQSKIEYNQKYHPMDKFIRPSQAAKVRAAYDGESDSVPSFRGEETSDYDSDVVVVSKRQKVASLPTRRSARSVNHNVLYNTNVHPQDEAIGQMDIVDSQDEVCTASKKSTVLLDSVGIIDSEVGSEDEISASDKLTADAPLDQMDGADGQQQVEDEGESERSDKTAKVDGSDVDEVPDTDDETSSEEEDASSPPTFSAPATAAYTSPALGSPLSDITDLVNPSDSRSSASSPRPCPVIRGTRSPKAPSFEIYTESLAIQLAAERSGLGPLSYHHHDQENDMNNFPHEVQRDPIGHIIVQSMEEYEASQARVSHASDLPSMFDGSMDHVQHQVQLHRLPLYRNHDRDSVLGTSSPGSDVTSRMSLGSYLYPGSHRKTSHNAWRSLR